MRDYKFRAWDKETEAMYYSADYENCTFCVDDESGFLKCFVPEVVPETRDEPEYVVGREIQPILQFTGLLDKNGKEIYEGDILRTGETSEFDCIVKFGDTYEIMSEGEGYYGWYCEYIKPPRHYQACQLNFSIKHTSEIIGNAHENPELMKD